MKNKLKNQNIDSFEINCDYVYPYPHEYEKLKDSEVRQYIHITSVMYGWYTKTKRETVVCPYHHLKYVQMISPCCGDLACSGTCPIGDYEVCGIQRVNCLCSTNDITISRVPLQLDKYVRKRRRKNKFTNYI